MLPVDVDVLSLYPHAHYLGKEMEGVAHAGRHDAHAPAHPAMGLHWQQDYRYMTAVPLPRGTRVTMQYIYDNSENRRNPHNPPVRLLNGPYSRDEMGDFWLQVLPKSRRRRRHARAEQAARDAV